MVKRVLLIDETGRCTPVYRALIEAQDVVVISEGLNAEAPGALAATPVDLVLLDHDGPAGAALDLARRLRHRPALGSTPIVALSGFAVLNELAAHRGALFAALLPKPVVPAALLASLREQLDRATG